MFDAGIWAKLKRAVLCSEFMEESSDTLKRVKPHESTIILRVINAHVGNIAGLWKSVTIVCTQPNLAINADPNGGFFSFSITFKKT